MRYQNEDHIVESTCKTWEVSFVTSWETFRLAKTDMVHLADNTSKLLTCNIPNRILWKLSGDPLHACEGSNHLIIIWMTQQCVRLLRSTIGTKEKIYSNCCEIIRDFSGRVEYQKIQLQYVPEDYSKNFLC